MNQCWANEGLSEPFVTEVMGILRVDGWNGRRRAAMQIEALRANYDFYNRYGGFLDVLEAIALFSNLGTRPDTHGAQLVAARYLAEAGWRFDKIALTQIGLAVLPGDDQSYNGLEGNLRHLRGGLMVIRDVWLVPQFLRSTCDYACRMVLQELEADIRCQDDTREDARAQAWSMRQEWLKTVLDKLELGKWRSLGWSCIYEKALEKTGDEKKLVRDLIHDDPQASPKPSVPNAGDIDPHIGIVVNPDGRDIDPGIKATVDTGGKEPV